MTNKNLVNLFSDEKIRKETFEKSAIILKKEARDNGYKLTPLGLSLFLDHCEDRLGVEKTNYYRMCIPFAVE